MRLADQAAVRAAAAAGPVVALFVLDDHRPAVASAPEPWRQGWAMGAAQRWWLHHALASLDADLRKRGGRLVLRRGRSTEIVPAIAADVGAEAVHCLGHIEPWARDDEEAVAARVKLEIHEGVLLVRPESVRTGTGGRYRIFTPWWRRMREQMPPARPAPAPAKMDFVADVTSDRLEDLKLLPTNPDWSGGFTVWQPGEAGAAARLEDFAGRAAAYDEARNMPSVEGTSRLSPHLAMGDISVATIWHAIADAVPVSAEPYLRELGWRDFAANILDLFPDHGEVPGREVFSKLAFLDDPEGLRAWQQGRTGYPIVDAGMRQLWAIGWMHNRVRMITASFLCKHLLIDWRHGERWFWDCLVDADLASNSLGWQWVMGSGVDSSPFNRVFAPVGQSAKFDAAAYIREWVPELRHVSESRIHAPWESGGVKGYPPPIIRHEAARARALEAYAAAR
ncbi:deoxyribodipyrimidine photo-lyase [Polymorphobacter multimanifer]|uniref:Deoxyribodipyrimidine photo-lyase n=2 Tax=Polymorphobacter multimanifer TaxID=1070431 RepID=A0A841L9N1_9SPHN|nr:deoxyribodipyrimidine photo-lyase [Polymorphobacter multimanifer]